MDGAFIRRKKEATSRSKKIHVNDLRRRIRTPRNYILDKVHILKTYLDVVT